MSREFQRCSKCVMDTSDPEIIFDENGVCNHCRSYEVRAKNELHEPEQAQRKLKLLVDEIRRSGNGRKYDCVLGVSGGVDSTTAAYTVRKMGLRALAVHVDNGWNAELAVSNIENTLNVLGVDLHTCVIDWEEFRNLQIAFFKSSVANVEVLTDHAITAEMFRCAYQYDIKYVISGGNVATEAIMPDSWMYDARDLRHIKAINKKFGEMPLKTFPHCSLARYFYYIFIKRIKYIPILNYINYNKEEAKDLIQRELGWRDYGGKHYESIFTRFFQAYYLPKKFSIDKRLAHLSTLICSKQITREKALSELSKPAYPKELFDEDYEFFLKKMKLTTEEFEEIINAPPRTYKDYPSNKLVFAGAPWVITFIKRTVKPRALQ